MATRKALTPAAAIDFVKTYAVPSDYGCTTWEEVLDTGLDHVDGLAVALGIDDEYIIDHS